MAKYDYLVVGVGLYGAVFAHEARKAGKSVLAIDRRPNIAGNVLGWRGQAPGSGR